MKRSCLKRRLTVYGRDGKKINFKRREQGKKIGGMRVIKVGGAIFWSWDKAHATSMCVLRQPVTVPCTYLCTAPATLYATFRDTYVGHAPTLQYDKLSDTRRDNDINMQYSTRKNKLKSSCVPCFSASTMAFLRIGILVKNAIICWLCEVGVHHHIHGCQRPYFNTPPWWKSVVTGTPTMLTPDTKTRLGLHIRTRVLTVQVWKADDTNGTYSVRVWTVAIWLESCHKLQVVSLPARKNSRKKA